MREFAAAIDEPWAAPAVRTPGAEISGCAVFSAKMALAS